MRALLHVLLLSFTLGGFARGNPPPALAAEPDAKIAPYLALQIEGWLDTPASALASSGDPDRVDVIIRASHDITARLEAQGLEVRTVLGDGALITAGAPRPAIAMLAADPDIVAIEASKPLDASWLVPPNALSSRLDHQPLDASIVDSRVPKAWELKDGEGRPIRGRGVLIGVVDTGIDWTHPNFVSPLGAPRIVSLWDQTMAGTGPSGSAFKYGVECRANFAPGGCASADTQGHGSHVASIAAGSPPGTGSPKYVGVAPDADIIAVKYAESGAKAIDAWAYIIDQAKALGRPVVINNSWSHGLSARDGSDPLEEAIDRLSGPGVVFVNSAGNNGGRAIHAHGKLAQGGTTTLTFGLPSSSTRKTTAMTLWYAGADTIEVTVETPAGEVAGTVKKGERATPTAKDGTRFVMDAKTAPYAGNGMNALLLVIENETGAVGEWKVRLQATVIKGDGTFHAWLPLAQSGGEQFTSSHKSLDTQTGTPATAKRVITVANYTTRRCFTSVNFQVFCFSAANINTGDLHPSSSSGPTRDLRNKPDIAAPGALIFAALSKDAPETNNLSPRRIFVSTDGRHVGQTGTSMAAPHVTGTVALMLQKNPKLTPEQVKTALVTGARKDSFTGALAWSPTWGAGKLDAFAAVNATPAYVAPLKAPAAASPAHLTLLPGLGTELTWTNPPGTTQYHLQVTPANNDGPGLNVIRDAATAQVVAAPAAGVGPYIMLPGMGYTWRLRVSAVTTAIAEDDSSWSEWSEPRTFRTAVRTSAGISAASHQGGIPVPITPQTLLWQNTDSDVFYYELQLSTDPSFETDPVRATAAVWTNLVHAGVSARPSSWVTPVLEHEATYYWRLRPRVQGDGTPVAWSQTFSFRTD